MWLTRNPVLDFSSWSNVQRSQHSRKEISGCSKRNRMFREFSIVSEETAKAWTGCGNGEGNRTHIREALRCKGWPDWSLERTRWAVYCVSKGWGYFPQMRISLREEKKVSFMLAGLYLHSLWGFSEKLSSAMTEDDAWSPEEKADPEMYISATGI